MSDPERTASADADSSIDVVDILLTLAENLRTILIVVGLAASMALVFVASKPERFVSVAVIDLLAHAPLDDTHESGRLRSYASRQISAALSSETVLQEAVARVGLNASTSPPPSVSVDVRAADRFVDLRVTAASAQQAQQLAKAVVESAIEYLKPVGADRERREKRLDALQVQARALTETLERLNAKLKLQPQSADLGSLATGQAMVVSNLADLQLKIAIEEAQLQLLSVASVVEQPSLPGAPEGISRSGLAVMTALGTGFVLTILLLLRGAFQGVRLSRRQSARLEALKSRYLRKG